MPYVAAGTPVTAVPTGVGSERAMRDGPAADDVQRLRFPPLPGHIPPCPRARRRHRRPESRVKDHRCAHSGRSRSAGGTAPGTPGALYSDPVNNIERYRHGHLWEEER